jgi:hypothetical protein
MSEQRKAVIKNADMSDQMQQDAVDIASKALSEYSIEKVRISLFRTFVMVSSALAKDDRCDLGLATAFFQLYVPHLIFSFMDPSRTLPPTSRKSSIENTGQRGAYGLMTGSLTLD